MKVTLKYKCPQAQTMNTAYRVMLLYANGIYTRDKRHAMILVSWIETFIFIRGVIIQMTPMK